MSTFFKGFGKMGRFIFKMALLAVLGIGNSLQNQGKHDNAILDLVWY